MLCLLLACLRACSPYSSTLRMEAVCSSKMSVNVYQNAECQIPDIHTQRRENLKSHNFGLEACIVLTVSVFSLNVGWLLRSRG
jgi:hypothetical protein